jgi:hypothetical protein
MTEFDQEPVVGFSEQDGQIKILVCYPRKRFSDSGMARFATNISEFLRQMIAEPTRRIMDVEMK